MSQAAASYAALRAEVGARWIDRDVLAVQGPDAVSYLQGQLSQDVSTLEVGEAVLSLVLEPQGRINALVRVTRVGDEAVVVDTDAGYGEAVAERLRRFKLRTRIELTPLAWRCLALRGERLAERLPALSMAARGGEGPKAAGLVGEQEGWRPLSEAPVSGPLEPRCLGLPSLWPAWPGVDLLGASPTPPEGVPLVDAEAWEACRIEAGLPMMGRELTERTIPAEAGLLEVAVSFTKGCYTGQELVERLDARGNRVPFRLRGVLVGSKEPPPAGAKLERSGKPVGTVTSVARSPELETIALASVRREVEPPADLELTWNGATCAARVLELPLVAPPTGARG
jgi:folate-binding protein YgfZ